MRVFLPRTRFSFPRQHFLSWGRMGHQSACHSVPVLSPTSPCCGKIILVLCFRPGLFHTLSSLGLCPPTLFLNSFPIFQKLVPSTVIIMTNGQVYLLEICSGVVNEARFLFNCPTVTCLGAELHSKHNDLLMLLIYLFRGSINTLGQNLCGCISLPPAARIC